MPKNNLIIFLKYPETGKVKTRLGKSIGFEKAADIYSILTRHLFLQLKDSEQYCLTLLFTPEEKQKEISEWLNTVDLYPQSGNSLGEKLSNAFDNSFSNSYTNTVVIGSDCIEITKDNLFAAFSYLDNGYDSVIGPTDDGGYYLIGFSNRNYPELFEDIEWSTEKVFSQTLSKINQYKLNNMVLNYYNDIDEISDINSKVIKIINKYSPNLRLTD